MAANYGAVIYNSISYILHQLLVIIVIIVSVVSVYQLYHYITNTVHIYINRHYGI